MGKYPNYRITVDIIIIKENKVLIAKRRDDVLVMPGIWHVPAGKVRYDEVPIEGMYRECLEETGLKAKLIREVNIRTVQHDTLKEKCYRCVFTYLVKAEGDDYSDFSLNDEHTEFAWVSRDEIMNEKYDSLSKDLRKIILEKVL